MNVAALSARLRYLASRDAPLSRHLLGAAAGSLLLNLSSKALMLLASILLARLLGAEDFGIYASAMAVLALLVIPTQLGLPILVVRLLASYRVHHQWALMRGLLQRVNVIVPLLALLIAGVGTAAVWALSERIAPVYARTLLWAMALLPVLALGALPAAALRGLHHVVLGQLPQNLVTPGLFVALAAMWVLLTPNLVPVLTPGTAVMLYFAGATVSLAVGAWLLLRHLPLQLRNIVPRYETRRWLRAAVPLLFLAGMSIINTRTDVVMLAAIQGAESAGVYQAAVRGAELVVFALIVVNAAIQPTIARLYASGQLGRLQRVVTAAARGALALALPVALILGVFGRPLLGLVFGAEFERGANALVILCAAHLVNAAAGSVGTILSMTGHERDYAVGTAVGAVVNVVLNAAFIPLWDIEGAAFATASSLVAWNLILIVAVRRRTGLKTTVVA